MNMPDDFPPVPKCFSQLVNSHIYNYINANESEDQMQLMLSQSLPLSVRGRPSPSYEPNNNNFFRSLSENSPHVTDKSITQMDQDIFLGLNHEREKQDLELSNGDYKKCSSPEPNDLSNPFVKLNTSLEKLQKEMKELRLFDVSLFCQLLSLNDAIQDMKFNIGDRYSETGSEYSLGSASYMGSMSSLDEESDWGDSQILTSSFRGDDSALEDDKSRQSTSTLLKQITALTQRAEED